MKTMTALLKVQQKLKAPKDKTNSFGGYKYRSCESILEAVKPYLMEEGLLLTITDEVVSIGDRFYIKATATVQSIEGDEAPIKVSAYAREEDAKKGMSSEQLSGSCSSYARKYCLSGMFLLDDSKDADSDEYRRQTEGPHYTCEVCGREITEAVAKKSLQKYGHRLCGAECRDIMTKENHYA